MKLRVGYLIGALNPGGSERQLTELAMGMAARGHRVEIACYDGPGKFDLAAERGGARVRVMDGGSRLHKIQNVRRWIEEFQPQLLHGFMKRASSLAVLANLPGRGCRIVASDFSTATYARRQPALWGALALFHLADRVVTQTEINKRSIATMAPLLKPKLRLVRNGVDIVRFSPVPRSANDVFQFLCVGAVFKVKNPIGVVEAVRVLRERGVRPFRLIWAGRFSRGAESERSVDYLEAVARIERHGLADIVTFKGEVQAIEQDYRAADALLHVSVQEGIPNAVVEGMACGLPIVVSRVSDLPLFVAEASNGFVCDAEKPATIAAAMDKMMRASDQERQAMGERSRRLAVDWFGPERFISEYETLYAELGAGEARN